MSEVKGMHRDLRRKERAMNELAAGELLERAEYGVLSTCGSDAEPYGVPINYCVMNGSIYFHCAVEGRKLDNVAANGKVSFCVVGKTELLPDQFATRYQSVVVSGTAAEVFEAEKQSALESFLAKYSAQYRREGLDYIKAMAGVTRVFRIRIKAVCGKARR